MKLLLTICLTALALTAADVNVTGKWTGTAVMSTPDGQTRDTSAMMVLKNNGKEVTGTVGPNEEQQFPAKGTIDGDKIVLDVETDGPKVKFQLTVNGDKLTGEGTATMDGNDRKIKVDLTRAK